MELLVIIFSCILFVKADDCGPLGYKATDLLQPSHWFFDLDHKDCPPIGTGSFVNSSVANTTSCRVYFNLCKEMAFQCTGTVCLNYVDTEDYIIQLGSLHSHPFKESDNSFEATFTGQELECDKGLMKVTTTFVFDCNKNATWNRNIEGSHGGERSPTPRDAYFDSELCKYTVKFYYDGACYVIPEGDQLAKNISTGSLILILFFPSVLLYFLIGMLYNRKQGKSGKDMVPHREFWIQLPELIMDGFAFSMATITCRKEDRYLKDYENVDG